MAGETCEYILLGDATCGMPANPCSKCHRAFCGLCYAAHQKQDHLETKELALESVLAPTEAQASPEPTKPSVFDSLFVDEASESVLPKPVEPPAESPQEPEEPVTEEKVGEMLSVEMGRVVAALDLLAKRGLNQVAVIALIHDAEPKIPKSTILAVLKTLRMLPDLYGRKRPGRKI